MIKEVFKRNHCVYVYVDPKGGQSGFIEFRKDNSNYAARIVNFNPLTWGAIIDRARTFNWKPIGNATFVCSEKEMEEIVPMLFNQIRKIMMQSDYSMFSVSDDDRF